MRDGRRLAGAPKVTLLVRGTGLLPRMENFAWDLVAEALGAAGVDVRRNISVTAAERDRPGGPVTLLLGDQSRLETDEVLVAAGRAPRTSDLELGTVGLKDGSWLNVDDTCRVQGAGGWLYAAGDVNHLDGADVLRVLPCPAPSAPGQPRVLVPHADRHDGRPAEAGGSASPVIPAPGTCTFR